MNSLTLVIHSYFMNLFLPAGLMKIKFNVYKDNCIKGRTRFIMSGHHIKHTSAILPTYHKHNFFCISSYSEFHNKCQG